MAGLAGVLAICLAGAAPAMASQVVVRDTAIHSVFALGRTVVYARVIGHHAPYRFELFRASHGHRMRLRHVPAGTFPDSIGRDGHGRKVLTLEREVIRHDRLANVEWWLYDIGRQRARRLRSVPTGRCAPQDVSVWWHRAAYTRECERAGVFLRDRGHTRRVMRQEPEQQTLLLRANLLAAVMLEAEGDTAVWRLAADGKVCRLQIPDSYVEEEWQNKGVWLSGRNLVWAFQYSFSPTESDTVLGARLHGCGDPGPTGSLPVDAKMPQAPGARTVDGRWLYFSDAHHLRRARLPRAPVTAPPANDDFENATPLAGDPPITLADQVIGRATVQPGEPTEAAVTRTVWYAFRPATTERVFVSDNFYGATAVYEGDSLGSLTKVSSPATDTAVAFDAVAGHTYRISVGCSPGSTPQGFSTAYQCFLPYDLRLTTGQPPQP